MKNIKVLLTGPMESAGGNWNLPLFDFATTRMQAEGWEVFNPAEQLRAMNISLDEFLKLDDDARKFFRKEALKDTLLWLFDKAQLVMLLPGWERSARATAIRAAALAVDIEVRETGTILLPADAVPPSKQGDTLGSIPD